VTKLVDKSGVLILKLVRPNRNA